MIEAVLFDWNNTLVHLEWDDERVELAHRAALGRDDPEFTARWRDVMFGDHRHRPYAEILTDLGVGDPEAFIDAEHEVWRPAHSVLASAQALLDALRARGVKTGVVANSWPDPGRVLRADAEAFGLAERFDTMVFSEELGVRKPAAEIFLHACRELGVEPIATVYVGDNLETDVQGAANVGMTTVQALWFRADDTPGIEADFMAFTPMDVLNVVRRLAP
ncbi:MAG TPA: HAD family hydrolase [Gaiellaceae bacterium]|nr:HAD family hydrolase [Gaiellaceae bacterium]